MALEKLSEIAKRRTFCLLHLVSYKIGFLTFYGSHGILTFYLPLYCKQRGLTPVQIGVVTCSRTVGGLFGGFLFSRWSKSLAKQQHLVTILCAANIVLTLPIGLIGPIKRMECQVNVTSNHEELSSNDRSWMFQAENLSVVFITINILVFTADMSSFCINTVLHGGTMLQLGKHDTKSFGHIRAWGAIGQAMSFLLMGSIVSGSVSQRRICGSLVIEADYHLMFYIFLSFAFVGVVNGDFISIRKPVESGDEKDVPPVVQTHNKFRTFRNTAWIIVQFTRSMFFSVSHGFLNWHIENRGASPMTIGGLSMVVVFAQTVAFFSTRQLIQMFGHSNIIFADLLSQIVRFVIFSLISNPLYILPFVAVEGLMFASTWSTTASYLSNQVPEERQTEVQGLLQTVHTSGKATGFLLSGFLTQSLGAPDMFLVFGAIAFFMLIFFFIAHRI